MEGEKEVVDGGRDAALLEDDVVEVSDGIVWRKRIARGVLELEEAWDKAVRI